MEAAGEDRPGDVPVYLSDCSRLFSHTGWRPARTARDIIADIADWTAEHETQLAMVL